MKSPSTDFPWTLEGLREAYLSGQFCLDNLQAELQRRLGTANNSPTWIHLLTTDQLRPYINRLKQSNPADLPLYGIPFAIKDNIDLADIPTTAGCPDFQYTPKSSAPVVDKLIKAGAIPVGKTNLDQFATGLVGVRSPYGTPINRYAPDRVPGGSSSGSATAVADEVVIFSLGTDTAGSGRVPAAFLNLWGLKPSCGRLSTTGLVPACRSLDCITLFAKDSGELSTLLKVVEGYDPVDPFSHPCINRSGKGLGILGIPPAHQCHFFGDAGYADLWEKKLEDLRAQGWSLQEIDFQPFLETARLLYEGPWVAERYAAVGKFLEERLEAFYPTTRTIIEGGKKPLAVDAFKAFYRLQEKKRQCHEILEGLDALVTPTAGGHPTLADLKADPLGPNSQLGYYTNFMNLLDLCAVAQPAGCSPQGISFGITWASTREKEQQLLLWAKNGPEAQIKPSATLDIVLFGAHMEGLPLNPQVTSRGARFLRQAITAPHYRMFLLEKPLPPRPGVVRDKDKGTCLEGEIWRFPMEEVGDFLANIPHPLGLGEIELNNAEWVHGFLCSEVPPHAPCISSFKSWRAYLEQGQKP